MAGHSKWANIQHRKGRQDAKRGKLWTKIIREVTVAARAGGPDPDANPRLRLAWDKATATNITTLVMRTMVPTSEVVKHRIEACGDDHQRAISH